MTVQSFLTGNVCEEAKRHARRVYPEESCGLVVGDTYLPAENIALDPAQHEKDNPDCHCRLCSFEIAPGFYMAAQKKAPIKAILHSHPGGPLFPSEADMKSQLQTAVPWGIVPIIVEDEECRVGDPILWGDQLPMAPIVGRQFLHGIHDCYSLIRDTFRLGKEKLAEQDVTKNWPFDPIELPEVPRSDAWWDGEKDLYADGMKQHGFKPIDASEARPGDGFLIKVRSDKFNHAGLMIDNHLILHHLPTRLSRREPAGIWGRQAGLWVRYEGPGA